MPAELAPRDDLRPALRSRTAARLTPSGRRGLWDALVDAGELEPTPAEQRAMAFAARLGPTRRTSPTWEWDEPVREDEVIDLAAEEAAVEYLRRLVDDVC